MNTDSRQTDSTVIGGHKSRAVRLILLLIPLAFFALAAWLWLRPGKPAAPQQGAIAPDSEALTPGAPVVFQPAVARQRNPKMFVNSSLLASLPPATAAQRDLVSRIISPEANQSPAIVQQAATWKENFKEMIDQGAAAIPAIRQFLHTNIDFEFGENGRETFGYATARLALIDALSQIGGPQAVATMAETLQNSADPREIAVLGQKLETLDPGVHQSEILDAARQTLEMSARGQLPDRDVAPLFETLQKVGGAAAVTDLQQSAQHWNFYSAIALAQLPDEAGAASLAQMASGQSLSGSDARTPALQMLTEMAVQSEEARNALVDLIRKNSLSAYDWATLAPVLTGNQLVFQNSAFDNKLAGISPNEIRKVTMGMGNQSFMWAPLGVQTPAQITQQQALLDQLINAATDPTAQQALQKARTALQSRLPANSTASRQ
jgi:hypothetical protein